METGHVTQQAVMAGWRQAIRRDYPEWQHKMYCVPPLYFNRLNYTTRHVAGLRVLVQQPFGGTSSAEGATTSQPAASQPVVSKSVPSQPVSSSQVTSSQPASSHPAPFILRSLPGEPVQTIKPDTHDDFSQQHVMFNLQTLGRRHSEPMFLISQLDYADILRKVKPNKKHRKQRKEKTCSGAVCDVQLPRHVDLPERDRNGDFDLLDVHLRHGIVIGEIKAVGLDGAKDDDVVSRRVKHAVQQLEKSGRVLAYLLSDITPGVRIVKTIILPYITSQQLERVLSLSTDLLQAVCVTLGVNPPDVKTATQLCVCADQLSHRAAPHDITEHSLTQLSGWFTRRVSAAEDPAMTQDVYLSILARLVGPASTVSIHCITPPRVEVRTLGEAVSELGERLAQVVLTPAQLSLLNRVDSLPRVCLVGPPGTGKTLMLVLVSLHWLRKGHDVLVLRGTFESNSVSEVIKHQLEMTLSADPTPQDGAVLFHNLELGAGPTPVEERIQSLAVLSSGRVQHIIMDETSFNEETHGPYLCQTVATLLKHVPGLHLWTATLYNEGIPPELHVETLTVPLRSAPVIVREIQPVLVGATRTPSYSDSGVPSPSDGPTVIRLRHEGGQHVGRWPLQCHQCGLEVADVLQHQLHVGARGPGTTTSSPPLQYRDVLVLTRDMRLTSKNSQFVRGHRITMESNLGFVTALRARGIPVGVCPTVDEMDLVEAAREDMVFMRTDQVTVANVGFLMGLERKVVVWLPGRMQGFDEHAVDGGAEVVDRMTIVSRCSTQLVIVDVPPADARELMHQAWLVQRFMGAYTSMMRVLGSADSIMASSRIMSELIRMNVKPSPAMEALEKWLRKNVKLSPAMEEFIRLSDQGL